MAYNTAAAFAEAVDLMEMEKWALAQAKFQEVLDVDPEDAAAQHNLSEVLAKV